MAEIKTPARLLTQTAALLALALAAGHLSLQAYSRDLAEGTINPVAAGQGGIGTTVFQPAEGAAFNPANLGPLERTGGGLNFGFADNLFAFQGMFFLPSSLGVLGISPLIIRDSVPGDLDLYVALPFGYARNLTDRLSFGFYLKPAYGSGDGGSFLGLGLEPSLLYNTQSNLSLIQNFGFYNFSFYFQPRNLSLNFGNSDIAPRPALHVGLQSGFFRSGLWQANWYAETYGINRFDTFPVLGGLSLQYWYLFFRIGGMYTSENQLHRGVSLGGGMDIPFEQGNVALHYALLPPFRERKEMVHFVSAYGSFGSIDREGPVIDLKTDVTAFSPDANGSNDYVHFDIKVSDRSAIRDWRLEIRNSAGIPVRVFENDRRQVESKFGIKDFFSHFFTGREALIVPRRIRWDGTGDAISIEQATKEEGQERPKSILPDGEYSYTMTATDIHGNPSRQVTGSLMLDTSPPKMKVHVEDKVFSPNGDGIQDELKVDLQFTGMKDDNYLISIEDSRGVMVKSTAFTGLAAPPRFVWDGNDDYGNEAPEGLYTLRITGTDAAGNSAHIKIAGITLVRRVDIVELQLSNTGFSPNGDGRHDTLTIRPVIPEKSGLEYWEIVVTRKHPEPDRPKPDLIVEWNGVTGESIPKEIIWDGRDGAARLVADGIYYIAMRATYDSGNRPTSRVHPVIVDNTPPITAVESDLPVFSPDGDGMDEEQVFRLDIQDASELAEYRLNIYEIQYDENDKKSRIPFKVFSGIGSYPTKIYWDGKSDSGNLVESATWYEYELTAMDAYGNLSVTAPGRFETDILVIQTERGLKIRLSAIEFDTGKATIKKKTYPLLTKLARTLQRYPAYRIKIEGHTDNVGAEEFNLKLSEDRARAVMNHLIQEGIEPTRLSFQGMGEVHPLLPNTNWYNRSRNRRVEFILIR